MVYCNVTFTHTDDPYMQHVAFIVLPREGEDVAIVATPTPDSPHQRIDKVIRVRHYAGTPSHEDPGIELILGER